VVPRQSRGTVNRKAITAAEEEAGREILGRLTAALGRTRPLSWEAHRVKIIGRLRAFPDLTVEDHFRIIDASFADPWWTGAPGPEVVYGNDAIFERSLAVAHEDGTAAQSKAITGAALRAMADQAEREARTGEDPNVYPEAGIVGYVRPDDRS
jgi:hypothetical protein